MNHYALKMDSVSRAETLFPHNTIEFLLRTMHLSSYIIVKAFFFILSVIFFNSSFIHYIPFPSLLPIPPSIILLLQIHSPSKNKNKQSTTAKTDSQSCQPSIGSL